jgi:hypothetical protein
MRVAFPNRELKRDLVEFLVDPSLAESLSMSSILHNKLNYLIN